MRLARVIVFLVLLLAVQALATYGQEVVATWTDTSGNWSNPANWSTLTVPNNSGGTTYSVTIASPNAVVSMDLLNNTIDNLSLGTTNTLTINAGDSMSLAPGPSFNYGVLTNAGSFTTWSLTNSGTLTNASGALFTNLQTLTNSATLINNGKLSGMGDVNNTGTFNNNGLFSGGNGAGLINTGVTTNAGTIANVFNIGNTGTLVNASGGLIYNAGIHFYNLSGGVLINSGTIINSTTGYMLNEGAITNASGSTMNNAGSIQNYGSFSNAGTFTNSGLYEDISFNGGRSTNNSGTIINTGTMYSYGSNTGTIINSGQLDWGFPAGSGRFVNSSGGTLTIEDGGDTGVIVNDGNLYIKNSIHNTGGVTNFGSMTIVPYGSLTINGDYEQTITGILCFQMSPYSQAFLNASGNVVLDPGATLQISLLNGFYPLVGQTFDIMNYHSLTGTFYNSYFWDDNYLWDVTYGQNQIDVTAVKEPEPSSVFLLAAGALAILGLVKRKVMAQ